MQLEQLKTLLASKRTEDRIKAVTALMRSGEPEARGLLRKALRDRVAYVAALAAEGLAQQAEEDDTRDLTERFLWLSKEGRQRDPGCHIRGHLAIALGRIGSWFGADALRIGIRTIQVEPVGGVPFDTAAHLRANCALALATMHAPDCLRDITLLLFDLSGYAQGGSNAHLKVEPRKAAARAMAILGDPNALVPLTLRLYYPATEQPEVLQECMQALVALQDDRALEILSPYLRHQDRPLAAFAALMIAQTQQPGAIPLLIEAIPMFTGDPLRAVVLALTTHRSDEARIALRSLSAHPRETVRLALIEALRGSLDAADHACLCQMAEEDASAAVRREARHALP